MSTKKSFQQSVRVNSENASNQMSASTATGPDVQFNKALKMVEDKKYDEILALTKGATDRRLLNLRAVVLMRMDRPAEAITILHRLTMSSNNLDFLPEAPIHFKTNLMTALLMSGKVGGCLALMDNLRDSNSPQLLRLRSSIKAWEKTLWGLRWLDWKLCKIEHHTGKFPLDFVPGELLAIESVQSNRGSSLTPSANTVSSKLAV